MVFDAMGGVEIATVVFVTLSFVWNIVQAYVFIQERYKPPEEREQFDGRAYAMLREVYTSTQDHLAVQHATLNNVAQSVARLGGLVQDLHGWHNVMDDDGQRLWFFPRSHMRRMDAVYYQFFGGGGAGSGDAARPIARFGPPSSSSSSSSSAI